jgi:hypothetical protein
MVSTALPPLPLLHLHGASSPLLALRSLQPQPSPKPQVTGTSSQRASPILQPTRMFTPQQAQQACHFQLLHFSPAHTSAAPSAAGASASAPAPASASAAATATATTGTGSGAGAAALPAASALAARRGEGAALSSSSVLATLPRSSPSSVMATSSATFLRVRVGGQEGVGG